MTGRLSDNQIADYHRDGFLFPLDVFDLDEIRRLRAEFEDLERRYGDGGLPRRIGQYLRNNVQLVVPMAVEIATRSSVLDAVESILGPDLLIWSVELFIKEPGTEKVVSWHQDLTYWGLGETDLEVTAWIALSPATADSGCMRFLPGSHKQRILPHRDTFAENNLLSRGQEVAVEVKEADAALVALQPGQMSLHHGRMFHASGPNGSDDRRIGLAIRYLAPEVRQVVGERDYAILARGADRSGHWINVAPPRAAFDQAGLALYEEVAELHGKILGAGADKEMSLYRKG